MFTRRARMWLASWEFLPRRFASSITRERERTGTVAMTTRLKPLQFFRRRRVSLKIRSAASWYRPSAVCWKVGNSNSSVTDYVNQPWRFKRVLDGRRIQDAGRKRFLNESQAD